MDIPPVEFHYTVKEDKILLTKTDLVALITYMIIKYDAENPPHNHPVDLYEYCADALERMIN